MAPVRRLHVIAALLLAVGLVGYFVLRQVVWTVFFAVTVAYVLMPVRERLAARGAPRKVASAGTAVGAFLVAAAVVAPVTVALYARRQALFEFIDSLPDRVVIPLGRMQFVVETQSALEGVVRAIRTLAVELASAAAVLSLKLVLFVILLYALLLRPEAAGRAVYAVVPDSYHDVVDRLDARVRATLYGIYVLQAATAGGTFVVALVVFALLGYTAPFTLAVIAGVLQFIPVLGPSLVVGALAVIDLVVGNAERAILVAVLGGVFVAALPDAVIRPRLASWAADLPTSLYFIGFVGGVLTVGGIGFVAGPLAVALIAEVIDILADAEIEEGLHAR